MSVFKRLGISLIAVVAVFLVSAPAMAAGQNLSPQYVGFPYWKVTAVSGSYWSRDPWFNGPTGTGPSTLGFTQALSVTNQVTGTLTVSLAVVSASVGYSVGNTYTETSEYSVSVPSGTTKQILWTNWYHQKTVSETEYTPPGEPQKVLGYATCYARQWSHFAYTWAWR